MRGLTSGAVAALLAIKFHAFAASGCAAYGAGKGFEPVQHVGRWRGICLLQERAGSLGCEISNRIKIGISSLFELIFDLIHVSNYNSN